MICRHARAAILATVRQQASEAERLCLEEHLQGCPACRAERAQWLLLERLRDEPAPHLGTEARARVLRHLTSLPRTEPAREPRRFRLGRPAWALAAAALLVTSLWVWRGSKLTLRSSAGLNQGSTRVVRAQAAGNLASAGAHIAYPAGAAFDMQPERREIHLLAGEIDVDVVPGGTSRFRVITPRFTVEVLGTRFIVGLDGVRTLHGSVRVVDAEGRELALVQAGQSWKPEPVLADQRRGQAARPVVVELGPRAGEAGRAEDRSSHAEATSAPHRPLAMRSPVTAPGSGRRARPAPVAPLDEPSVDSLLSEARILLGSGDTTAARQRIAVALQQPHLTPRQRAGAELLTANALLVESRYQEAISAFRRTANLYGSQPEGELAVFALAQLLSERGLAGEAQAAFRQYLDRYPGGQFMDEVRRQLHLPATPDPLRAP